MKRDHGRSRLGGQSVGQLPVDFEADPVPSAGLSIDWANLSAALAGELNDLESRVLIAVWKDGLPVSHLAERLNCSTWQARQAAAKVEKLIHAKRDAFRRAVITATGRDSRRLSFRTRVAGGRYMWNLARLSPLFAEVMKREQMSLTIFNSISLKKAPGWKCISEGQFSMAQETDEEIGCQCEEARPARAVPKHYQLAEAILRIRMGRRGMPDETAQALARAMARLWQEAAGGYEALADPNSPYTAWLVALHGSQWPAGRKASTITLGDWRVILTTVNANCIGREGGLADVLTAIHGEPILTLNIGDFLADIADVLGVV